MHASECHDNDGLSLNYDRQMQDQTYCSALLAASEGAAFVVDVGEGRFVAANTAADTLWGSPALQGSRIDSAMPAMAR